MSDLVTTELLEALNLEFFELCEERHNKGADEYGPLNFLKVDLPTFIYEEMADIANYARFLFIRVRLLEEVASERGIDLSAALTGEIRDEDEVSFGASSFVSQPEVSTFLPDKDRR